MKSLLFGILLMLNLSTFAQQPFYTFEQPARYAYGPDSLTRLITKLGPKRDYKNYGYVQFTVDTKGRLTNPLRLKECLVSDTFISRIMKHVVFIPARLQNKPRTNIVILKVRY